MSTVQQASAQVQTYSQTSINRLRWRKSAGWLAVRGALALICILWTLPTFGLLISSLRPKDALATSGWWTALAPSITAARARTGGAADQQEVDGRYVITGSILDAGDTRQIDSFGDGFLGGDLADNKPGTPIETDSGYTFTLQADGSYELSSPEPFDAENGYRFFFQAATPPALTLDNYTEVINSQGVGDAFLNTFTVVIPSTVIPIAIAAFAAYAFAWMNFPGRRMLFYLVVALMVVPLQMSLIPLLRIYSAVGIVGTFPGIWLAHTGFGLPLAIFLLRSYIGGLPRELIESANIDGASHFQIFTKLIVPLSIPALASFSIFQFLWVWNDMLVALVFLGQEQPVLTVQLAALTGSRGDNWEILTSAAFVSIVVPLLVFFSLQRYFVRGLLAGSVKGG
ncbi:MAG: carbohydrate ABC transporter permease [Anaerolineae bacterium]|nr:carbohydrate ABC transporter permease [Anaerolineae bacterium]